MADFQVFSPADGELLPLEQVPDPAFAEHMLGDGIAVNPSAGFIVAPFDGVITSVHQSLHAVTIKNGSLEVLIHVGVDTVSLKGQGFKALVKNGDSVKKGQKLTEFDKDFLAKKAPSNWVIMVVTAPDGASLKKQPQGPVHAGKDLVFSLPLQDASADTAAPAASADTKWIYSPEIIIQCRDGLHARPAARLADAAKQFPFHIELETDHSCADAKSLVAVMGLGIASGAKIRLRTSSPDGADALKKLTALLEDGLGESTARSTTVEEKKEALAATEPLPNMLKAFTACAGIASGKSWLWQKQTVEVNHTVTSPEQEQTNLEEALRKVLQDFAAEMKVAPSKAAHDILQAHVGLLQDPFLTTKAKDHIRQGKSASAAFNEAIRASIDVLKATKNRLLMERVADLKDLRSRVLLKLAGKTVQKPEFPDNCILLAEELLPSDLSYFDSRVKGVLLAGSSPTAHVAILLRNMGLPSLVAAGENVLRIADGTPLIINASEALVYINPDESESKRLQKISEQEKIAQTQNAKTACKPAVTKDGVQIHVTGNASGEKEAHAAQNNGADGLGLVRTEFIFYQGKEAPTEEEQYQLYQNIASALQGKPVTLRTLDAGGDKPVSYMPLPEEENPIMGMRGIRTYTRHRHLFLTQIRAMLRVANSAPLRIMLPMVAFEDEFLEYKKLIEKEKQTLGISAPVEVGMMIEVPSAALTSGLLSQHADFFSIGTNDLTQYTLAIDRGHRTLCYRADPMHPAVLQLIGLTCQGAATHNRPVAVCGAMAGDLLAVPLLIGLGVSELAVGANAIAQVKARVRNLSKAHCEQVAKQALACPDAHAVRELVKKEFGTN